MLKLLSTQKQGKDDDYELAHDEVQGKIQKFYDDKDVIVFGCAGLKGILHSGLSCSGTGLFMFGEVCTISGHSDFGNLMLSKLKTKEKR